MGLTPMIFSMMGLSAPEHKSPSPRLTIVGPLGLRAFLRANLTISYATLSSYFVVHELLFPSQPAYPHKPADSSPNIRYTETDEFLPENVIGQMRTLPIMPPHENELPGRNIVMDRNTGTWEKVIQVGDFTVSAAPITHRCPTVGYVLEEAKSASRSLTPREMAILDSNTQALFEQQGVKNPRSLIPILLKKRENLHLPDGNVLVPPPLDRPGRKLCILGDTSDASGGLTRKGMVTLARNADIMVHECTYASMSEKDMELAREVSEDRAKLLQNALLRPDEAKTRALSRGHSIPQIVGEFSALIETKRVILNHFSARLPAPLVQSHDPLVSTDQLVTNSHIEESKQRLYVMQEIERQVTCFWRNNCPAYTRWNEEARAVAAYDGLCVTIPPHAVSTSDHVSENASTRSTIPK